MVSSRIGLAFAPAVGLTLGLALLPAASPAQELLDPPPLFASAEPLRLTITADFTALRGDRRSSPRRPATLTVSDAVGAPVEVAATVRTRGAFRLDPSNCSFPPLRLRVDGASAVGTVLEGQDDLKFVSSCRPGRSAYEELVVKEYLAYRSVQAVTDASFRVRALEVTLHDTGGDEPRSRFAFVIENADALARRLGARVFDLQDGRRLPPAAFDPVSRMTNGVVHYMLGNLDWSDAAGHNVEVLERSNVALAIPYDFDFSGVVDAPYATPPAEIRLRSVRERYYRGWCENPITTREVLDRFRGARERVLAVWAETPLLSDRTRSRAVGYLNEFFSAVETDDRAQRRFLRDCRRLPGPPL